MDADTPTEVSPAVREISRFCSGARRPKVSAMNTFNPGDRKETLLLVDDNELLRRVLRMWLHRAGFAVVEAGTGKDGLLLAREKPNLIILDVRLPDMSGLEVCRHLKDDEATAHIPVLLLSGHFVGATDKIHGLEVGADSYLFKPVEEMELLATIRALLRVREAEHAAETLADEWQATFDAISDGICLLDLHGAIKRCNVALPRMLSTTPGTPAPFTTDILGRSFFSLLPESIRAAAEEVYRTMETSHQRASEELQVGEAWLRFVFDPVLDAADDLTATVCLVNDVTDRKLMDLLHLQSAALAAAVNAIFITDVEGKIQWTNEAASRLSGYAPEELLGEIPRALKADEKDESLYRDLWTAVRSGRPWSGEVVERRRDGSYYVVQQSITPLQNAVGEITHLIVIHEDITARKEAENRIAYLAYHDALTGLPNRVLFQERLVPALAQARRHDRLVALHFIDLDNFKDINDTLGHAVGDAVLREVAQRLRRSVRVSDTVARFGGDEFAIIQTDLTRSDGAAALASKLISVLAEPMMLVGHEVRIGCSIGLTVFPLDNVNAEQLLQNADIAMYQAKNEGRNTYRFYSGDLDAQLRARGDLLGDLRTALTRGELRLHYQPQVNLQTQEVVGIEALLRWQHPRQGLVSPVVFLGLAEESGLIEPLTRWVLEEGCTQLQRWHQDGFSALRLACNLSTASLRKSQVVQLTREILTTTGLASRFLEMEVTESLLLREAEVAQTVGQLHNLGLTISIDDFGTGYSSLNCLHALRVDKLKIDGSFIKNLPDDPNAVILTRAIIDLGHTLQLKVIAEGVETAEQAQFLRAHGCDEAQGYYFAPPMPPDEATAWMRNRGN